MTVPETTPLVVESENVPATVLGAPAEAPLVTESVSIAPDTLAGEPALIVICTGASGVEV